MKFISRWLFVGSVIGISKATDSVDYEYDILNRLISTRDTKESEKEGKQYTYDDFETESKQ